MAGPASSDNDGWTNLSETTYNGMILNDDTGASALRMPFVNASQRPIQLIRRPPSGESATSLLGQSRLYNQAQIRVFLNDSQADLPGGVGVQLVDGSYTADDTPFADDGGGVDEVDGYLLVQARQASQTYSNVTTEWLNLGIAREHTDAILKFQAVHDHAPPDGTLNHSYPETTAQRFDQLILYDAREGEVRNGVSHSDLALGGIMNFIELDVNNLKRWLAGTIGTTGPNVESTSQNGYLFYFSDRRGMLGDPDEGGAVMGEYGFENVVNPSVVSGAPNNQLDQAEDVDESGTLDEYGETNLGDGFGATNGHIERVSVNDAWENRVSGARHALKLINGSLGNLPTPGFTIDSENPVYVEGDYNATGSFSDPGDLRSSAAVIADAVTFLSNGWLDYISVLNPTSASSRGATTTYYRVAVAAGKNLNWDKPSWSFNPNDGQDGGVGSFLRSLEMWTAGEFNYQGSLVSLFNSEYATGTFKCYGTVFSMIGANFTFETDFLDFTQMPPATPWFEDLVTLGYRQVF